MYIPILRVVRPLCCDDHAGLGRAPRRFMQCVAFHELEGHSIEGQIIKPMWSGSDGLLSLGRFVLTTSYVACVGTEISVLK
jgi:hypothetical protein